MARRKICQMSILLFAFSVFSAVNISRAAERPTLPKEAQQVLQYFQQALTDADWAKALDYCSAAVKKKAAQKESPEALLKEVVPIAEVIATDVNRPSGWSSNGDKITRAFLEVRIWDSNWQYPLRWQLSVVKRDGKWFVDFGTKPLDVWRKHEVLKSRWINDGFTREGMQAMIYKANQGLELRLVPLSDKFTIGNPMLFRVVMCNKSGETLGYTAVGGGDMVNDPMLVQGPGGQKLSSMDGPAQTVVWTEFIEPNETVELVREYDVRSQYHIIRPGRYSFQLRPRWGLTQPSNVVEVDVLPGELSAIEDVVEKLKPILPAGWQLSPRQFTLDEFEESPVQVVSVYMVGRAGQKATENHGIACSVMIPLAVAREQVGNQEVLGEYLGQCTWGPVFLMSQDAEKLWPTWKENIGKALAVR